VKVTSCLVLTEAAKWLDLASHLTALRVGEFEVATSGGIWVAIRAQQKTEAWISASVLNVMSDLGMPVSVKV